LWYVVSITMIFWNSDGAFQYNIFPRSFYFMAFYFILHKRRSRATPYLLHYLLTESSQFTPSASSAPSILGSLSRAKAPSTKNRLAIQEPASSFTQDRFTSFQQNLVRNIIADNRVPNFLTAGPTLRWVPPLLVLRVARCIADPSPRAWRLGFIKRSRSQRTQSAVAIHMYNSLNLQYNQKKEVWSW
jgi:hypothetical protein